jgi:hypothetical protein
LVTKDYKKPQTRINDLRKAGQNHDIKIANRYFENVAQLRYLGTAIRNQNLIQKEIKRRLNLGNALLPFSPEPFCLLVCSLKTKN